MGKKCTMKDVAQKLGLSINAISLALNDRDGVKEETRLLVLQTAKEMGYIHRKPHLKQIYISHNICVMIRSNHFRSSRFYNKVLLGAEEEARRRGYNISVSFFDDNGDIPVALQEGSVCGILLIGAVHDDFIHKLQDYQIPIVTADYRSRIDNVDSVMSDNKFGAFHLTRLLIKNGYERIGYFGDLSYSPSVMERFYGYQEALWALPLLNSYAKVNDYILKYSVLENIERLIISRDSTGVKDKIQMLPQLPQAFVCSNDEAAFQVIEALKMLGYRVPEDVSVTGFDDLDIAALSVPKLTTVHVRRESLGCAGIQQLLRIRDNSKRRPDHILLGVEVILRDSVILRGKYNEDAVLSQMKTNQHQ